MEFSDPAQAAEANRRLNNQPFKGRNVTINEARARENRPDSGGAPRHAPRPGFAPTPRPSLKPSLGTPEFSPDMMDTSKTARAESRRRNFGADAKPAHKRKNLYGGKGEMGSRKGPIRERGGGQVFGSDDYDEDSDYDYLADFRDADED